VPSDFGPKSLFDCAAVPWLTTREVKERHGTRPTSEGLPDEAENDHRIMKAMAAPEGTPGYGTLAHGHRDDRT
jgi:hypothetical protein